MSDNTKQRGKNDPLKGDSQEVQEQKQLREVMENNARPVRNFNPVPPA